MSSYNLLAYHLINHIQNNISAEGLHHDWRAIRNALSGTRLVYATALQIGSNRRYCCAYNRFSSREQASRIECEIDRRNDECQVD